MDVQVWLSYASFEATPGSMLGEEQDGEASEADRRQAAAEQEGPAAAADREAHARRLALPLLPPPLPSLTSFRPISWPCLPLLPCRPPPLAPLHARPTPHAPLRLR